MGEEVAICHGNELRKSPNSWETIGANHVGKPAVLSPLSIRGTLSPLKKNFHFDANPSLPPRRRNLLPHPFRSPVSVVCRRKHACGAGRPPVDVVDLWCLQAAATLSFMAEKEQALKDLSLTLPFFLLEVRIRMVKLHSTRVLYRRVCSLELASTAITDRPRNRKSSPVCITMRGELFWHQRDGEEFSSRNTVEITPSPFWFLRAASCVVNTKSLLEKCESMYQQYGQFHP